jgi:TPR repeat protein
VLREFLRKRWRSILVAGLCAVAGAVVWRVAPASQQAKVDEAEAEKPAVCDPADWASCVREGLRVEARDPSTAAGFYARACEARFYPGCTRQGALEERTDQPKEALASFGAACDGRDLMGCIRLGGLHERGVDWRIVKDYGKARALYKKACDGGEGEGCVAMAEMREHAHGYSPDDFKETALYVKGCEKKDPRACFRLAERYRAGRGARKNEAKADELQARACAQGYSEACAAAPAK